MLWLALHLPQLALEVFCATRAAAPDAQTRPVALMAGQRVHSVNRAAAECGIRPGFKRATALALAADLLTAESEPLREAAALQAVAYAALAFTPNVTLHDARSVLLEVQSSLRLFGGLAALRGALQQALAPLGHQVQMAAAPTALGAALLAQWFPRGHGDLVEGPHAGPHAAPRAGALRPLQQLLDEAPLWLLGPGREHWEALQGMGLQTLADLRSLPRSGVARRFSAGLLEDLGRAYGERPDPRSWAELPAQFSSRLELFTRAENTEQVLHGAQLLLARLVPWAQARQARVRAFTLRMLHERQRQALHAPTELRVELAEPSLDAAHLRLLLRERLGRIVLAAPTLELQLECHEIALAPAPNAELFPTRASQAEGLTRLLERLRARLGDAQVLRIVPVPDHRPTHATLEVPVGAAAVNAGSASSSPHLQQPAWLWSEPLPLAQRGELPLLQGQALRLLSGPERIESGWWDGEPMARDYYVAQTPGGALVWVFVQPAAPGQPAQWWLQGRFG